MNTGTISYPDLDPPSSIPLPSSIYTGCMYYKKGICKNTTYFVSDLAERVHLVDSVSNSEQNFDIYINIRYNSDQAFLIEQYPALYWLNHLSGPYFFSHPIVRVTHILGRHEICQKI